MSFQFPLAPHMAQIPSNPIFHLLPKLNEPGFISFAAGVPSPDSFPYDEIAKMAAETLAGNPKEILQYGSTEGYLPLRRAMAQHLRRYSFNAGIDELVITTGGQQAIDLLCKLFVEPGDAVLAEAPTYSAAIQVFKSYKANIVSIESDDAGILPDDLESKIARHRPKFVYLIPTFKNPSGQTLSAERRAAAAEITGRLGVMLIEDDPYRDLRYEGGHLPNIKGYDRAGNVVYITSASKYFCPGLRVGTIYAPKNLTPVLTVAKQATDMHSPTLTQAIVCAYLESGRMEAHLKMLCDMYRARLKAMLEAAAAFFPESVACAPPQGGLFLWCVCPPHVDTLALLAEAVERKVAYIPGDQFYADGSVKNAMRLNFSNEPEDSIFKGMEILSKLLRTVC
ncbi:MAG: PLP-dependent aminotransferase family protein [Clostridiales bacterium]|jgi:2-aminoadipate transaminase|nr:PLP-dependent aminotransferase family protein [Clostridiales bacterium]